MSEDNLDTSEFALESVFVLHRHSVRAPTYYAPNFEEIHPKSYPRGAGYLTRRGIDLCLSVAETWRSWYPEHINGSDHRTIFVRSSESPRCNETISAILHALFSSGPEGLNLVPIYSPPPGYDKYVSCAGFDGDISSRMRKVYQEPVLEANSANAKTVSELHDFIKTCFKAPDASEYDAFVYIDGVTSNVYEGLPQPKFFTDNEAALKKFYHFAYHTVIEEFSPFYGFHLLQGMARRMQQVFDGELTTGQKWCDYSFHDFNLSSALLALEAEVREPKPNFLGAIFFELRRNQKDGSRVVDLYYCSGLQPDGRYSQREPLRMRWNQNSHRATFDKLYEKMFNNIYVKTMRSLETNKYTGDDAMV
ncbi:uncharacterized protein LOC100908628 [Galendromus occidentalis]|uniref:Uncharacterized protein LOC100908628 n=1 Tax=Galendromus occidentalis TaxID=34638 RepID=A0AAJ6QNH3_9ACAR|nr:uncharacterized protein LOC100908628 [Galendromus occidentalis]